MKDLINDAKSLLGASAYSDGVKRRDFIRAAVGTGFAAAALPVVAQTPKRAAALPGKAMRVRQQRHHFLGPAIFMRQLRLARARAVEADIRAPAEQMIDLGSRGLL